METGKTGKYFKYAIGEIILVVIGILIALQINNWNEGRKEKAIELSYLERLVIDLEEDKDLWKKTIDRKKRQLEASHVFLDFRFSKNQDTVVKILPYFQAVGSWVDININQVTFSEMVSSGNLNIINNDSIKIKLLKLDKLYKTILNNQSVIKEEHQARILEPVMRIVNTGNAFVLDREESSAIKREFSQEELNSYFNEFQKDLITLINDKEFINGVVGIPYNAKSQFSRFEQATSKVEELIALIKEEINTN